MQTYDYGALADALIDDTVDYSIDSDSVDELFPRTKAFLDALVAEGWPKVEDFS